MPTSVIGGLGAPQRLAILFSVRKTLVTGWVGKSQFCRILESYEIWKLQSASLTVIVTIRCIDVADSTQFVAELHNRGERIFFARCSSCCGRPGHPFGKSSSEGALDSECSSYYKTTNALLQLHPGMTRTFFFVPLKKEWSATNEGKR